MSGNIYDTDVDTIKSQINEMISELDNIYKTEKNVHLYEDVLKKKYSQLYTTSKTLFEFILNKFNNKLFDINYFNQTIEKMLNAITDIQKSKITQHDASVNIGYHLAKKYIPEYKK